MITIYFSKRDGSGHFIARGRSIRTAVEKLAPLMTSEELNAGFIYDAGKCSYQAQDIIKSVNIPSQWNQTYAYPITKDEFDTLVKSLAM